MKQSESIWTWFSARIADAWDFLAKYPSAPKSRWFNAVVLAGLFLAGLFGWGTFYNWGRFPVNFHDWADVSAPRFSLLKDAANHRVLPLHMQNPDAFGSVTNRYMSLPDAFLSPQFVFLRFMDVQHFAFCDIAGMYALGFLGLLWLRRKFSLSPVAFCALFFLFNFNGDILAHLSVGHETWGGYFLFPWFVGLIFDLLEGDRSWKWVAKVAFLLLVILLQGAYHQFVWALFFLGLISLSRKGLFLPALKAAVASVLLSAARILPVWLHAGTFESGYHGGFPGLAELGQSLVVLQRPGIKVDSPSLTRPVGSWEFSLYVGLAGAVFLLFFGLYRWLRDRDAGRGTYALLLPIAGLALLSLNDVFAVVRMVPFPMFTGERVSSRIISLPFVFLLVLAAFQFQRWLNRPRRWTGLAALLVVAGLAVGVRDLWQNLRVWSILNAHAAFQQFQIAPDRWHLENIYGDRAYIGALVLGSALTLLTAGTLLVLAWREKRQAGEMKPEPAPLPPLS